MRGLNRLIPDDLRNRLNESPITKYVVVALLLIVGPLLIRNGIRGVRDKRVMSKGREYTGGAAVAVGALQCLAGGMALAGAVFALLVR
ncbi:MAG: hypothetical protein WKF75_13390 [Singulisphaera sp.]